MAAPRTGVIRASIRMTRKRVIERKGINTRRLRSPGADSVRRVMSRLVKDIVVLTPDRMTLIIAISWAPNPVKRVLLEKGVINVQPAITSVELLALGSDFFLTRLVLSCVVINHRESDTLVRFANKRFLIEKSKKTAPSSVFIFFNGVVPAPNSGFALGVTTRLSKSKPEGCFIKLK